MTRREERDKQIEMALVTLEPPQGEDVKAASFERPIATIIRILQRGCKKGCATSIAVTRQMR
jgi:hypothetical protein